MDQGFKEFILNKAFTKKGQLKPEVAREMTRCETLAHFVERQMPLWGDQYVQHTGLPLKQDYAKDAATIIKASLALAAKK